MYVIYIHTYVCMYVYICKYIHVCMQVHTCIHMYLYTIHAIIGDIINDCDNNNGTCNLICVNTNRNFIFECKTGYQLNDVLMTFSCM